MQITMKMGELFDAFAEFNGIEFADNKEVDVSESGVYIQSIDSFEKINFLIMKETEGLRLIFSDGTLLRCAENHILFSNGNEIFARELKVGDKVDGLESKTIEKIEFTGKDCFYDVALDAPHIYVDSDGIIHHNSAISAALAKKVKNYGRILVIVPNVDLVIQTAAVFNQMGVKTGMFYGGEKDLKQHATICTWQSLNAFYKKPRGMEKLTPEEIHDLLDGTKAIIVDECFSGDMKVTTDQGQCRIDELNPGDLVVTKNEHSGAQELKPIVKVHRSISSAEKMYELEMNTGVTIKVTGNHKFMTQRGWVRADQLNFDDEIIELD